LVSDAAQIYDEGRGAAAAWTPVLAGPLAAASTSGSVQVAGALFTGISEGGSGSTQSSPANNPVLLLRRLDSEAMAFATATAWTATTANFTLPPWLHQGQYLAWVVVNGVLSNGQVLATDLCNTIGRCGSDCRPCLGAHASDSSCGGNLEPAATACKLTCLPGFANQDKDRANGCEPVVAMPDAAVVLPDSAPPRLDAEPPGADLGPNAEAPRPSDAAVAADLPRSADAASPKLVHRGGCTCQAQPGHMGLLPGLLLLALLALPGRRRRW
jgi:MYXO-CTERM domain-containing protein